MLRRLLPLLLLGPLVSCGGSSTTPTPVNVPFSTTDLIVGTGTTVATGMAVEYTYIVYLYSATAANNEGTEIDSSTVSGPVIEIVGSGQVVPGVDQGLIGMKVGGRRQIVIPPALGYGSAGSGSVPPNSTLLFIIDLEQAAAVTSLKPTVPSTLSPPR
jgi:FKBP-type peptidyl-prolyl cis-trans isomerase